MARDEKARQGNANRQRRHYNNHKPNAALMPPSHASSSSSSSSKNNTCTKTEVLPRVNPAEKRPRQAYPPEFEEIWSAFPNRAGGNSKKKAFKAYQARLRDEPPTTQAELLAGVKRYAAYAAASNIIGTNHVQMVATFLGPDEHWRETWGPPRSNGEVAGPGRTVKTFDEFKRAKGLA